MKNGSMSVVADLTQQGKCAGTVRLKFDKKQLADIVDYLAFMLNHAWKNEEVKTPEFAISTIYDYELVEELEFSNQAGQARNILNESCPLRDRQREIQDWPISGQKDTLLSHRRSDQ